MQVLGCDQTTKTVLSLHALAHEAAALETYLRLTMTSLATASLKRMEEMGLTDAARVLRGADPAMVSKSAFIGQAHAQISKVKTAMRREMQACLDDNPIGAAIQVDVNQ